MGIEDDEKVNFPGIYGETSSVNMDIPNEEGLPDLGPSVFKGMDECSSDGESDSYENLEKAMANVTEEEVNSILKIVLKGNGSSLQHEQGLEQVPMMSDDAPDNGGPVTYPEVIEASDPDDLLQKVEDFFQVKESKKFSNNESRTTSVATSVVSAEPAMELSSVNSGNGPVCPEPTSVPTKQAASKQQRTLSDVVNKIKNKITPPRNRVKYLPLEETEKGKKAAANPLRAKRQNAMQKATQPENTPSQESEPELPAAGAGRSAVLAVSQTVDSIQRQELNRSKTKSNYVPRASPDKKIIGRSRKNIWKKKKGTGQPAHNIEKSPVGTDKTKEVQMGTPSDMSQVVVDGQNVLLANIEVPQASDSSQTNTVCVPVTIPPGMATETVAQSLSSCRNLVLNGSRVFAANSSEPQSLLCTKTGQTSSGAYSLLKKKIVPTNGASVKIVKPATPARKPLTKTVVTANQPQSSLVETGMKLPIPGVLQPAISTNKYNFTTSIPSDMVVKYDQPVVLHASSSPTQNGNVGPCTTAAKTVHRGVKHKENRESNHSPEPSLLGKSLLRQQKKNAVNPFYGNSQKWMKVNTHLGAKFESFINVESGDELEESHAHDDEKGCVSSVVSSNVPLTTSVSPHPTVSFSCAPRVTVSEQKNCPGVPCTYTAQLCSAESKALSPVLQDQLKRSFPRVGKRVHHHSETQSEFSDALSEPEVKRVKLHDSNDESEEWSKIAGELISRPFSNVISQSEIGERNPFDHTTEVVRSSFNGNPVKTTFTLRKKGSGQPVTTLPETENGYISRIPHYIGTSTPSVQIESGRKDLKAEDCVLGLVIDRLPMDEPNPENGMQSAFSKIPSYATNPANSTIFDTDGDSLVPATESSLRSKDSSRSRDRFGDGSGSRDCLRQWSRPTRSEDDDCKSPHTERSNLESWRERKTVYVGRIPRHYKDVHLKNMFGKFGPIRKTQVFIREHMDNYGFVTFVYAKDAANAIEQGTKDQLIPFELCYGERRQFCRSSYSDLDGNKACEEEYNSQPRSELPFDALLNQYVSQSRR